MHMKHVKLQINICAIYRFVPSRLNCHFSSSFLSRGSCKFSGCLSAALAAAARVKYFIVWRVSSVSNITCRFAKLDFSTRLEAGRSRIGFHFHRQLKACFGFMKEMLITKMSDCLDDWTCCKTWYEKWEFLLSSDIGRKRPVLCSQ